jgi:hypothetical protein
MNASLNTNDPERARNALFYIEPSCPREEWVRIGMAAKAAGLSFDAFHEWSTGGENYKNQQDCISAWRSFKETDGITPATLYDEAFRQGWKANWTARPKIANVSHAQCDPVKKPDNPALQTWELCTQAPPDNPYIIRKHGQPDGLRIYPDNAPQLIIKNQNVAGWLAVPALSNWHVQTIQFIPPNGGDKLNLPGASFNDGFFSVGAIPNNDYADEIHINEGIGQAWASNQAMGAPAVSCFGASRMLKIAKVLRAEYPVAKLVVVPDRGKEAEAAKIATAVSGYWVEMPSDKPSNYDVNDYLIEYGANALASLLSKTKSLPPIDTYQELQSDHESEECVMTSTIEPFPGLMTEIVNSALEAAHKPQKELTILSVLLGMSSTCTGEYILPGGGRLNLYGTGIAGTGCGKDHPRNVAELIAGAGCCQVIGQPGSGEGLEDLLESNKNLLLSIDEIAHLFEAINGSNKPPYLITLASNLLRLFTASKGIYRTRALAKVKGNSESAKAIHNSCVNLLGFATPEKLGRAARIANIEDGLLGRNLFAMGNDDIHPRRVRHTFLLPNSVIERVKEINRFTQDVHISMTPEANSILESLIIEFDTTGKQSSTLFERALKMRSFEKCERIAGVLAVWDDQEKPLVNVNHVEWAAHFVKYSDNTVLDFALISCTAVRFKPIPH